MSYPLYLQNWCFPLTSLPNRLIHASLGDFEGTERITRRNANWWPAELLLPRRGMTWPSRVFGPIRYQEC
jgi:hypothetical protein